VTKPFRALAFTGFIAVLIPLLVSCSGENKPSTSELREALVATLPDYVKVTDFNVEAIANEGNEVEPRFVSRYNAAVEVTDALYKRDGSDGDLLFLAPGGVAGDKADLFGKSLSVLYQGKWEHNVGIDGNPLNEMGRPLTEFAGKKTIIRGSAEETAHFDAMEQKDAAFAATTAALPLASMIAQYYDTKGEFAGRFEIHEVLAHRIEKVNNNQAKVHAKYTYKTPGADKASGEDRRAFTLLLSEGQDWQIAGMGTARSGRVE